MLRNILAAVVGYIAMAAVLFVLFSLLWLTLGPSRAFQPVSWEVSGGWALGSVVLGNRGRVRRRTSLCQGGAQCQGRHDSNRRRSRARGGDGPDTGGDDGRTSPRRRVDDGGDRRRPPAGMVHLAQPADRGRWRLARIAEVARVAVHSRRRRQLIGFSIQADSLRLIAYSLFLHCRNSCDRSGLP